jgi:hypothetical protein
MRRLTAVAIAAALMLLSGCAAMDKDKADAANFALNKVVVGGTLGECMNAAGFNVKAEDLAGGAVVAGTDWWRITFEPKKAGAAVPVRMGVHTGGNSIVVPYAESDRTLLDAIPCAVNGRSIA